MTPFRVPETREPEEECSRIIALARQVLTPTNVCCPRHYFLALNCLALWEARNMAGIETDQGDGHLINKARVLNSIVLSHEGSPAAALAVLIAAAHQLVIGNFENTEEFPNASCIPAEQMGRKGRPLVGRS